MDDKGVKEVENVASARRNTQLLPRDLSAMGSQGQQFEGDCSWCGDLWSHGERQSKESRLAKQPNKWMVWHGRQRQRQVWQGQKERTRTKERVNTRGGKERHNFTRWRGTTTRKKYKPVQNTQNGRTRAGIPLDNWAEADWWSSSPKYKDDCSFFTKIHHFLKYLGSRVFVQKHDFYDNKDSTQLNIHARRHAYKNYFSWKFCFCTKTRLHKYFSENGEKLCYFFDLQINVISAVELWTLTLHGNKRHDSCHRCNLLKNSPIQRTEGSISMSGGLTMCELAVDDEGDKHWYDTWNNGREGGSENWVSERDDGR